jgi:hypothetical protein
MGGDHRLTREADLVACPAAGGMGAGAGVA